MEEPSVFDGIEGNVLGGANVNCSQGTNGGNHYGIDDEVEVDGGIDMKFYTLTPQEVQMLEFSSWEAAFYFYYEYGKGNGFSIRKQKVGRNKDGVVVWRMFVCSRHGFRASKYLNKVDRKREHRPMTRCGCPAELKVRLNLATGRWYVAFFNEEHSHPLVPEKFTGMLRSHRKMSEGDVAQLNSMRKSGISTPKIFGSFACQSGGYEKVGFRIKDLYNEVGKQRRSQDGDINSALKFLRQLKSCDPMLFWSYKLGMDGTLLTLFWSDGSSQIDYFVFGDVLAFDATYRRNKYNCPLVVFSGVNHHKQTCIFGSALVSNETEETYVWLLQQLLIVMKGKFPRAVITDGDCAMRNAIKQVLPEAHHRLCAWHLLRNATTNVGQSKFTKMLKICMLGDFEIDEFEERWMVMVEECGVKDNVWVQDLYEKKMMWATAYIRGKFFAGLRTTSRCEALHAKVGKYVQSGYNVTEFLEHYQRCLEYLRHAENEADFRSYYGEPVMQTPFHKLERFGAQVFTREVFLMYRSVLYYSSTIKIDGVRETESSKIYIVGKYCKVGVNWHVSYSAELSEIRCSCQRMESYGIPCMHIMSVMVHEDVEELPRCLVLDRWTKLAKEGMEQKSTQGAIGGEKTLYTIRYGALVHSCRKMCHLCSKRDHYYHHIRETVAKETALIETMEKEHSGISQQGGGGSTIALVKDPMRATSKGSGRQYDTAGRKIKRQQRCGVCRRVGHNRSRCLIWSKVQNKCDTSTGESRGFFGDEDDDDAIDECNE